MVQRAYLQGMVTAAPNVWQITLGVMRMMHRMATRPESIGLSVDRPPRAGLRARVLRLRPLRFPFVLALGAVRPWDLSGLLSKPDELIRHLVGTHHDRHQFAYDLQILSLTDGALERLLEEASLVHTGAHEHARLMQDLCVYESYHDNLVHAARHALAGDFLLTHEELDDPDISFEAYLRWCQAQPASLGETLAALRKGTFVVRRDAPFGARV